MKFDLSYQIRKKILILTVVYFNTSIIKKHIDFLTTVSGRADIIVLENPSESTTDIKEYCLDLVKKSIIKQYCLFEENICGGVFKEIYINIDLINYDYIMVTDGDLTISTTGDWLSEQIKIVDKYSDTFVCAVDLSLDNLPINEYPGCEGWYPKSYNILNDCSEGDTGVYLLLFKKDRFISLMNYIHKNNKIFIDATLHKYCRENNLKWRRTKRSKAYHHTWDLYTQVNHPYTIMKNEKNNNDLWNVTKRSNYKSYELDSFNNY